MASIGPIRSRRPLIERTVTGCRPSGFGRSGDRVANTPVSGFRGSDRGRTFKTSRRPWCSHVITMTLSPAARRCNASAAHGKMSSQASGAPSPPCRGAFFRAFSVERMRPTWRSRPISLGFEVSAALATTSFLLARGPTPAPRARATRRRGVSALFFFRVLTPVCQSDRGLGCGKIPLAHASGNGHEQCCRRPRCNAGPESHRRIASGLEHQERCANRVGE